MLHPFCAPPLTHLPTQQPTYPPTPPPHPFFTHPPLLHLGVAVEFRDLRAPLHAARRPPFGFSHPRPRLHLERPLGLLLVFHRLARRLGRGNLGGPAAGARPGLRQGVVTAQMRCARLGPPVCVFFFCVGTVCRGKRPKSTRSVRGQRRGFFFGGRNSFVGMSLIFFTRAFHAGQRRPRRAWLGLTASYFLAGAFRLPFQKAPSKESAKREERWRGQNKMRGSIKK